MSNIVLTEEFVKLFTEAGKAETGAKKKRGALLDYCIDCGIDFTKETLTKEQLDEIRGLIALRFPPAARKLIKMGPKASGGEIVADWDGFTHNSRGQAHTWSHWDNEIKSIIRGLIRGLERRKNTTARIASGGSRIRTVQQVLSEETNKLFNKLINADVDKLPDDIDIEEATAAFKAVAKACGFTLIRKDK